MSVSAIGAALEQAGELKIGQVGIANLRVRTLDIARLAQEMRERVQRAPKLFARAALVIDFGGLSALPDAATAGALIDALRAAGVLPVALAWGSADNERLAGELGLPLLAKFRARYERPPEDATSVPVPAAAPPPAGEGRQPHTRVHTMPVRSGQQVYARNGDLTILAGVAAGAEVLADGSIHVYGPLRGRALAGAGGNPEARIFCHSFQAELVAVAGRYLVWDDVPHEFHGQPVHIRLEHERLRIERLPNQGSPPTS